MEMRHRQGHHSPPEKGLGDGKSRSLERKGKEGKGGKGREGVGSLYYNYTIQYDTILPRRGERERERKGKLW